jgi:UDP-4-amino-4,6-dideoxy-N-acetyl-beta-L-altrosamine transaminase
VAEFEQALAEYVGAKHVIAVSNGTTALHLAMLAARIGAGDKVVTSPNTFLASANCAEYVGASTRFSDIDPVSCNLDTALLEQNWQEGTKVVVAVDFAGQPCNMPEIARIARGNGAIVIEDAAHAIGSRFRVDGVEYPVGGHPWAELTTFSFHPVKTITTGEGGAIATNDDALAERCRSLRSHGMVKNRPEEPWYYEMAELGYNYRITDIQCALGLSQLKKLDGFIERRRQIVDRYNEAFQGLDWLCRPQIRGSGGFSPSRTVWHLYVVQINFTKIGKTRAQVMAQLLEAGIGTQVHYIPVHTQPYYREKYGYGAGDCPIAEAYYEKCLSLPLFPAMTDENIEQVIQAMKELYG